MLDAVRESKTAGAQRNVLHLLGLKTSITSASASALGVHRVADGGLLVDGLLFIQVQDGLIH